jgi:signal transduction histidine kinase
MDYLSHKKKRPFLFGKENKPTVESNFDNFYYKEVAKLTGAGGWSVNFRDKIRFIDPQGQKILNTPEDFKPTSETALDFYALDERKRAQRIFLECSKGVPFSTTMKMLTYDKKEFWARAAGEPLLDENDEIIGIHGVFQDINKEKLKEISLEKSLEVIATQNSRLFNFAHIVSHNLRSHSSNLQLTIELLNSINSEKEEKDLKESLVNISDSLNDTISHLNEIVTVHSKAKDEKREVVFDEVLENVKNSISRSMQDTDAEIFSDFSEVPSIKYIPAYMESIFLNLISNSIKYSQPESKPVIDLFTFTENGKDHLMIKDNGRGIDLSKYGDRIFNMYQTFHGNKDSIGIGLFITKNQVEAMGGTISIESTVDVGTIIKITF